MNILLCPPCSVCDLCGLFTANQSHLPLQIGLIASLRAVLWFPPSKDLSAPEVLMNALAQTPILSYMGSPSPQHISIWVLCTAVSTTTSPCGTGCVWPFLTCLPAPDPAQWLRCGSLAKTSGFTSLTPTLPCLSLCSLPNSLWPLEAPFLSSLSFMVPLASGRQKQAHTSHDLSNTRKLPEFVLPPRFPPSSFPRCCFSKCLRSSPVPVPLLPPSPPRSPSPRSHADVARLPIAAGAAWRSISLPVLPIKVALNFTLQPREENPGWLMFTSQRSDRLQRAWDRHGHQSRQIQTRFCWVCVNLGFFQPLIGWPNLGLFFFFFCYLKQQRYNPEKKANPPSSSAKPLLLNMGTAGFPPKQQEQLVTCGENWIFFFLILFLETVEQFFLK